jgi:asparagine synthase (glutamine-hydrolysing)
VLPAFTDASLDQRHHQLAHIRRVLRAHATPRRVLEEGIQFSHPWLDKRVLEFCLAAPPAFKVRNGYPRYLVRGALDGVLPKKIQWRTSKTPFSPDYYARYNSQLGKGLDFLNAIGPKDPIRQVIEIDRLRLMVKTVNPHVVNRIARDVVPRNLYAICFLRQFPEFRP